LPCQRKGEKTPPLFFLPFPEEKGLRNSRDKGKKKRKRRGKEGGGRAFPYSSQKGRKRGEMNLLLFKLAIKGKGSQEEMRKGTLKTLPSI